MSRACENRKFCVLGASVETGNHGVSALGLSTVKGLRLAFPDAAVALQSWGRAERLLLPDAGGSVDVESLWLYVTERLRARYGTGHLRMMHSLADRLPAALRPLIARSNRTLRQLWECDAVLDISAGDSFADIYGQALFEMQIAVKRLILDLGRPLVLLPQSFGPYHDPANARAAREIIERAALVATREITGLEELEALCGGRLPPGAVYCPDVAFLLEPAPVSPEREPALRERGDRPVVGVNVSGLLYFPERGFSTTVDYRALVQAIIAWAVERANADVVLIPHVIARSAEGEDLSAPWSAGEISDTTACREALRAASRYAGRVRCIGWPYTACETKYLIGTCDFFIGARMHACIGAVSQAVPAVALAYSKKARGVLGRLTGGDMVLDLSGGSIDGCIHHIERAFARRAETRAKLRREVPVLQSECRAFFVERLPRAMGVQTQLNDARRSTVCLDHTLKGTDESGHARCCNTVATGASRDVPHAGQGRSAGRIPMLDGWRGISILLVLACHMLPLGPRQWKLNSVAGPLGMSLFFTLSGFLITSALLGGMRPSVFFIRRACRILPLAVVYMVLVLTLLNKDWQYYASHLLFVLNYDHARIVPLTSYMWSLCVEVHFYAFVGLLVAVLGRRGLWLLPIICIGVTAMRIAHGVTLSIYTHHRVDEILVGACLAMVYHKQFGERCKSALACAYPSVLAVLAMMSCHPDTGWLRYLRPYLAAALIGSTLERGSNTPINRLLSSTFLQYMATVSYALYVWHPITMYGWLGTGEKFTKYLLKRPISFVLLFALAHISTFYYEKRWLEWGKRITQKAAP